jgi:hypothetical protein
MDDVPASKKPRVFFGDAEDQNSNETKQHGLGPQLGMSPAIAAGIKAGNINISDGATFDLTLASEARQQELLAEFERRKKVTLQSVLP